MCLWYPNKIEPDKPITVYKVFEVEDGPDGQVYHSPYNKYANHSTWKVGVMNELVEYKGILDTWSPVTGDNIYAPYCVGYGAFHSYAELKSAFNVANDFAESFKCKKYVVGECLIPVDSEYVYEGIDGRQRKSYASQKLMLLSIVDESNLWEKID